MHLVMVIKAVESSIVCCGGLRFGTNVKMSTTTKCWYRDVMDR